MATDTMQQIILGKGLENNSQEADSPFGIPLDDQLKAKSFVENNGDKINPGS